VGMVDPWELLDRASNIVSLIEWGIGGIAYVIYRNRDRLKRIAVKFKVTKPQDVVVQMKPAAVRIHAVSSVTATARVSRPSPTALDELLSWYLRIASA